MRAAIFSDVHGRIDRLTACLWAVADCGVEELWCLGDVVDAFAAVDPVVTAACVQAIDEACVVKLAGNHDAWTLEAGAAPLDALTRMSSWPVAAQRHGVLAVHGSPYNPLLGLISDTGSARAAIDAMSGWLCVHGHTHQPAAWVTGSDDVTGHRRQLTTIRVRRGSRAVACPGALSGARPRWLLVDTAKRRLTWHELPV